jgi:hypothetical protein
MEAVFGLSQDSKDDLLLKIVLDDPKQYEQVALESALAFIKKQLLKFD